MTTCVACASVVQDVLLCMLGLVLLLFPSLQTDLQSSCCCTLIAWLRLHDMTTAGAYVFTVPGGSCHQWTFLWD